MADLATMYGAGQVATFLGLPACADLATTRGKVVLIGVPCCTSYASVGAYCAGAPAAIRAAAATYAANVGHMNFDLQGPAFPDGNVVDAGDLAVVDGQGAANRASIERAVRAVLRAGGVPVILGGDDSVPIPVLAAYEGRRLSILQVDAHIDWRDEVQDERMGLSSVMRRASEMAHVERMVQVGQRGTGSARPSDVAAATAWGVTFVSGREVAREGVGRAVAAIPEGAEVFLAFDVDALDPAIMPAAIGRTAGGLSYTQALDLIEGVAAKARIAGVALIEFMPERDIDGLGAMLAAQMLTAILGIVARQP
jgi:agmatinase